MADMKKYSSRSTMRCRPVAPELAPSRPKKHAKTILSRADRRSLRGNSRHSSSSEQSFESSSSSSNDLAEEEIKFNQIDLHPYERRATMALTSSNPIINKLIYGSPEVRINEASMESEENWIPDTEGLAADHPNMVRSESKAYGQVKVFDTTTGAFFTSTREDAMVQYKAGRDIIVECSNYTRQDVIFFAKSLQINAVLCWELLAKYTPDKYQKFGPRCSFYAINVATSLEALKARTQPIKVIHQPRILVLFTPKALDFAAIVPASVTHITADVLLYLVMQSCISQTEEIVGELKGMVKGVYNGSFNKRNIRQRGNFVENLGEVRSLLLNINEQVEYKHGFLKELMGDGDLHLLFRYLMRHLRGKVRYTAANIKDMQLLLDVSKKQFDALIDQKMVEDNLRIDSYFKIIMAISVLTGVGDIISSLMGMNIKVPGKDDDTYASFSVLLILMVLGGVVVYYLLRWLRYFDF